MKGLNPRFNARGDLAYWFDGIHVNGARIGTEAALEPHWLTTDVLLVKGFDDRPYRLNVATAQRERLADIRAARFAAGGGTWAPTGGETIAVAVSRRGELATLTEQAGDNNDHTLVYLGATIVAHQSVHSPRAEDGLLVWTRFTGRPHDQEVWGLRTGGSPERLRVFEHSWEGSPVPAETPEGPWVLFQTNQDLRLHPWGSRLGYRVHTGEDQNFNPDLICLGHELHVAWNTASGELQRAVIPLSRNREDVSAPWSSPPIPVPDPDPDPHPSPEPEPVYQRRSPDMTHHVRNVAERFSEEWEAARKRPDGTRDDRFIRRCAWLLHQIDANVGLNGKRGSDTISTDALAYKNPTGPGGVEVIDVITGSHHAAWQDVTIPVGHPEHPAGVLGKFIQPVDPGGEPPVIDPDLDERVREAIAAALQPVVARLERAEQTIAQLRRELDEVKARNPGGGQLPARVAMKSAHGTYLTAEPDGKMSNRETQPASWQIFSLEKV